MNCAAYNIAPERVRLPLTGWPVGNVLLSIVSVFLISFFGQGYAQHISNGRSAYEKQKAKPVSSNVNKSVLSKTAASLSTTGIVINELGIAPANTSNDAGLGGEFIELFNKSASAIDISCYVIVYSGTSSVNGNASGWTVTIPANTILPSGSFYLIGGGGPITGSPTWTNLSANGFGAVDWTNLYGTNGSNTADINLGNSVTSALNSQKPGNLTNGSGQVTIYNSAGALVTCLSYNSGNNSGTYPASTNPASGCTATSLNDPGSCTTNFDATFSTSGIQGIYRDASGNYQSETTLTPGKSNALNGGTQSAACPGTTPLSVSHNTNPVTACSGYTPADLIATAAGGEAPYTYQWQLNGTGISGETSATFDVPQLTTPASYVYNVVITDACGNNATSQSKTITIVADPTVTISNAGTVCQGDTKTLTANVSGGTGLFDFIWESSSTGASPWTSVFVDNNQSSSSYSAVTTAVGTIYYRVTLSPNTASCNNSSAVVSVTVNAKPTTFNVTGGGNYCAGGTGKTVGLSGSQNGITYQLQHNGNNVGSSVSGTGGAISFGLNTSAGTYTVIATNTSTLCTALMNSSVVISIDPLPTVSFSKTDVLCFGNSTGAINITPAGGAQPYAYAWTGTGVNVTAEDQSNLAAGNYSVIVTDFNGCSSSALPVTINQPASAVIINSISSNTPVCTGNTLNLASTASGGTGTLSYSWTGPSFTSAEQNPSITNVTTAAGGQYTLTVTDFNNCSTAPSNTTVVITSLPVATFSYTGTPYCQNASNPSPTFSGGGVAGTFSSTTGLSLNSSTGEINLPATTPGTYIVTNTIAASGNCPQVTANSSITIAGMPTTAAAGTDQTGASTCGLTSVTLAANPPAIGTGLWTIVSGTGGTIANPTNPASPFSGIAGNTYTLQWTITNAPCAASSDQVTITFNQNPTPATAGPDRIDAGTCGLTSVTLAGNSPTIGTGAWSIVSGTGGAFSNSFSPASTFTGVAGSTYTLRWTISNSPCTPSTDDVVITFNTLPLITLQPENKNTCKDVVISLTAAASGVPAPTVQWELSTNNGSNWNSINGATSTTLSFTVNSNDNGNLYRAVFTNFCGTATSSSSLFTVSSPINISQQSPGNLYACENGTGPLIEVKGNGGQGPLSSIFQYSPDNGATWIDIPGTQQSTNTGTITAQYTPVPPYLVNGYRFRVKFNNNCPEQYSEASILTINTTPVVTQPGNKTVCNSEITAVNFTGTPASGTVYNWTNDNTSIGLAGNGSGDISFTAVNTGTSPVTANITVTPVYTAGGVSCPGTSKTFTITVNPTPAVTNTPLSQIICSAGTTSAVTLTSNVSGATFAWTATASAGVTGFTASGTNTIPAQTISTTGTTGGTVTYAITPTANGCPGPVTNYVVTVNPTPTVTNTPLAQTICSGGTTSAVTLTSNVSGATFAWTASASSGVTGFTASGTNTIPAQTISTTGNAAGTITYAITPTANGCPGPVTNYVVTVNPIPTVTNTPLTQTICSGGTTSAVTLTSNVSGATFTWTATASAGVSGFTASGTNTIPAQTISTTGTTAGTVTYAITPTANGCAGSVTNYTVTVNPRPLVTNTPLTQAICTGASTTLVTLTSNVSGATFAWTATATTGVSGFTTNGTNTIPVQTISTTGTTAGTVTYAITPSANGCPGSVTNYTVTVNVIPAVSVSPAAVTICSGGNTTLTASGATSYTWSPATGLSATTGSTVTANPTSTQTYTVTGTANGCTKNATTTVTVNTVNPGSVGSDQTLCFGGDPVAFTSNSAATGSGTISYQWQSSPTGGNPWTNISGATLATYDAPAITQNMFYRRVATSTLNGVTCSANSEDIEIVISPVFPGTIAADQSICPNGDPAAFTSVTPSSTTDSKVVLTYEWQFSTDGGTTWTTIAIAAPVPATYDPPAGLTTTTLYRRVTIGVRSTGRPTNRFTCVVYSNVITVTINNVTPGIIAGNQTICSAGNPLAFTVSPAATGSGTLTYQWQSSTTGCSGTFSDISGATLSTYDPPAGLLVTTYYRRVVTSTLNGNSCTATSNCITVTINDVAAGTISANQTVCAGGDPAAFTSTGVSGSGTLTYQWQSSTTGCSGTFTNIAGATSATYDVPAGILATTSYQLVVTSTLNGVPCSATGNCITVTVTPLPVMLYMQESFNSMTTGTIGTQNGWVPFQHGSGNNDLPVANTIPLVYSGYGSCDKYIEIDGGRDPYKPLATPIPTSSTTSIWTSFIVNTSDAGHWSGNTTPSVVLKNTANPTEYLSCFSIGTNNATVYYGISLGGSNITWSPPKVKDTTYLIVLRYDVNPSGTDAMYMWIDPPLTSQPSTATAAAVVTGGPESTYGNQVNALQVLQGTGAGNPPDAKFDDFKVSRNWQNLVDQYDFMYCNGASASAINFHSETPGATFTWTSTANVGFGTSGTGDISAFTATNNTGSPVTATISVTPTANGCTGPVTTYTVTVFPSTTVNDPTDQVVCNGGNTAAINFTGSGSTYTWTNNTPGIGLAASGTGNIPSFTAVNNTGVPVTATITVTSSSVTSCISCASASQTFTITVNPTPAVNQPANQSLCAGVSTSAITFGGTGTSYTWTNNNTNTGLAASGNGDIAAFVTTNNTATPIVSTVIVTPVYTNNNVSCNGPTKTFTITVNPLPTINGTLAICVGATTQLTGSGSPATPTAWVSSSPAVATINNSGLVTGVTQGTTTITYTDSNGCTQTATITVTPKPTPTIYHN